MKVIKDYSEFIHSAENKTIIYKRDYINFSLFNDKKPLDSFLHNKIIATLPAGNSIWIDSFGYAMGLEKIISFENRYFKEVFDTLNIKSKKIHFTGDFLATRTIKTIEKIYNPSSLVFYFSPFLKYKTLKEYNFFLNLYFNFFPKRKIILLTDLKFVNFNRIVFTNDMAVNEICNNISKEQLKTQKLDTFKYMIEIN